MAGLRIILAAAELSGVAAAQQTVLFQLKTADLPISTGRAAGASCWLTAGVSKGCWEKQAQGARGGEIARALDRLSRRARSAVRRRRRFLETRPRYWFSEGLVNGIFNMRAIEAWDRASSKGGCSALSASGDQLPVILNPDDPETAFGVVLDRKR